MNKVKDIKVVMFDLGNVIICFDHMIAAEKIAKYCDRRPREIYDLFFYSDLTEKFDSGKIDEGEFFNEVKKLLNLNGLDKPGFYKIWNDIFWENPGIAEVITEVKRHYDKFFIISNVNKPHFEYIWREFPIVREADEIILSYEIGVLKPAPEIYKIAIEKAQCLPSEVFYIDDRPELVTAAREMGIVAQVFSSVEKIRKTLII